MDGPITSNPGAFLSLLGAKTMGRAPSELGNTVTPTIDLRSHYVAGQLQYTSDFVAAIVLGGSNPQLFSATTPLLTPNGKVRFPLAFGISVVSPAASAIKITPVLIHNATTGKAVPLGPPITVGASESPWIGVQLPDGLILTAGMGFGYQVASLTGAAVQAAAFLLYAEFSAGV